jgi:hypothetical protein
VGVKLSGLYAISQPSHAYPHHSAHPFIRQLYDDFGPKRLYWGSDFSPALEHVSFSQTIDAIFQLGWPANDLQGITHDNLARAIHSCQSNQSGSGAAHRARRSNPKPCQWRARSDAPDLEGVTIRFNPTPNQNHSHKFCS